MKTLLAIFLATLLATTSHGQTVKALSYNTNGVVVYSSNVSSLWFPGDINTITFGGATNGSSSPVMTIDADDQQVNFIGQVYFDVYEGALTSLGIEWARSDRPIREMFNIGNRPIGDINYNTIPLEGTNAEANGGVFEILKGTNVNRTALVVAGARNVIELWNTYGNVSIERPDTYLEGPLSGSSIGARPGSTNRSVSEFNVSLVTDYNFRQSVMTLTGTNAEFEIPLGFIGTNAALHAAQTRANLGLPLAALTNDSNVTLMRALSGSTNTNHPFSGSVSVVGTNNTNTLVFSNGILQSVQ
jgi:hypothetical protein